MPDFSGADCASVAEAGRMSDEIKDAGSAVVRKVAIVVGALVYDVTLVALTVLFVEYFHI